MDDRPPLVDRVAEQAAFAEALETARLGARRVVALVGEPGIGKTSLLQVAADRATSLGFAVASAAADEEFRAPFFLATTLLRAPELADAAAGIGQESLLEDSIGALTGSTSADGDGMALAQGTLQVFDRVATALRRIAEKSPVALFMDDLQWADDDSIRLVRYLLRTNTNSRLFVGMAVRTEAGPSSSALALIADLERLRLARRLQLERLGPGDIRKLLEQLLEGPVNPETVTTLTERSEGVPFFAEELARALRDARILRRIDGTWRIVQGADHLVPASVQSLVERRLARLPEETRVALSDAAILGRTINLDVIAAACRRTGGLAGRTAEELAGRLAPAVAAGILVELPEGSGDDYAFTHNQVREILSAEVNRQRRRDIHGAVVDIMDADTDRSLARLSAIANHAIAAGRADAAIRYCLEASQAALRSHAPEEALRLVDTALAVATVPGDRVSLLRLRDEAYEALGRGGDRAASLSQLAAIAEALHDPILELDVLLRRAGAARQMEEYERGAELASEAQRRAAERGDRPNELAATLELGQALLRSPLGEGYMLTPTEDDMDGAEAAYSRALELALELERAPAAAAATRELGLVMNGRARKAYVEIFERPDHPRTIEGIIEVEGPIIRARELFGEAIERFTKIGDRRGVMSSLIGLAFAQITELSRGRGQATVYEQIRRLMSNLGRMSGESERATSEARMLYATHVYARLFHHPDVALERGTEAHAAARSIGDRRMPFLAAGGMVLEHVELNEVAAAEMWLERAREAADDWPGAFTAGRLATWRGLVRWAADDADGMLDEFEAALSLAADEGTAAAQCELMAMVALRSALLGAKLGDQRLLDRAGELARDALPRAHALVGQHPWEAQSEAALAQVALARGEIPESIERAQAAVAAFQRVNHLLALDLEVYLVALRALAPIQAPELDHARGELRWFLQEMLKWVLDEDVRRRWFNAPVQWEIGQLLGNVEVAVGDTPTPRGLTEQELRLLRLTLGGRSEPEIAAELSLTPPLVTRAMHGVFRKLGVTSAGEANIVAVAEGIV